MTSACTVSGRLAGERSLNTTPHGYAIASDIVRAGQESQRFEVRSGDCGAAGGWSDCATDRERSEFSLRDRWAYGEDRWIGFSVYLPPDFQASDRVNVTVGQIHQQGGPTGTAGGFRSLPPLMQMNLRGKRYVMCVHMLSGDAGQVRDRCRYLPLLDISEMRGRWTDIVVHFDTSGGRQVLEVLANGRRVAAVRDWIKFRPRAYYFKYGVYRSFVSRHGGPMPTQVVYIDEVRMGASRAAVRVNPKAPVD